MIQKKFSLSLVSVLVIILCSFLLGHFLFPEKNKLMSSEKKVLYWHDPMEPNVHYPHPGKSSMGMTLTPVYAPSNTASGAPTVTIDPQIVENLGIRTAPVIRSDLSRVIQTVAYVQSNENNIRHIHTYTSGWVRNLAIKTAGDPVKKGQLLFQLYSPQLVNAQEEFLLTLQNGSPDLIVASQNKLQAMGVSTQQIQQIKQTRKANALIDVYSPQNGFVTELNIRQGMNITPEMTLMSLVDLSTVWLMAQVFEAQASWVKPGEQADIRFDAFPGKIWSGKVDYVYPEIDVKTRTLPVRVRLDNPHEEIKPRMYASIQVRATPENNVLNIPLEALIRGQTTDHVIVSLGQGQFQVKSVVAGIESGNRVAIMSGLKGDEQVVTSGQFLIDSEANLQASFQRLQMSSSSMEKKAS